MPGRSHRGEIRRRQADASPVEGGHGWRLLGRGDAMRAERRNTSAAAQEPPRWVQWRVRRLRSLGFSTDLAEELARDGQLDIHALLELVDRGCPPILAARILAPLDSEPPPRRPTPWLPPDPCIG